MARIILAPAGEEIALGDELKAGFAAPPLIVPLDQPWVIAPDQGLALTAQSGRWNSHITGPVMLVGAQE